MSTILNSEPCIMMHKLQFNSTQQVVTLNKFQNYNHKSQQVSTATQPSQQHQHVHVYRYSYITTHSPQPTSTPTLPSSLNPNVTPPDLWFETTYNKTERDEAEKEKRKIFV